MLHYVAYTKCTWKHNVWKELYVRYLADARAVCSIVVQRIYMHFAIVNAAVEPKTF